MHNQNFGKKGEEEASNYLKKIGYSILQKNYLKRIGETDIIAYDNNEKEYVFIEVKSRHGNEFGYPEESVDYKKLSKMAKAAESWMTEKNLINTEWRLDVIALEYNKNNHPQIIHLKNIGE